MRFDLFYRFFGGLLHVLRFVFIKSRDLVRGVYAHVDVARAGARNRHRIVVGVGSGADYRAIADATGHFVGHAARAGRCG